MTPRPHSACGAAAVWPRPPLHRPVRRLAALAACALGLAWSAPGARAEKADRDKPLQVESDRLEYDDVKQISVFTGNVTLTKGTLVIRGDRIVVRQDPEGYQYGDAYGKPSTFRQKRDAPGDQWIEGWGSRLEYDGRQDTVRLHERAGLRRLESARITDEVYGSLITYDNRTEFFTVDGGRPPAAATAGAAGAAGGSPRGRVRVVIQPRQTDGAPPSAPVPLRPADRIASPREPAPSVAPAAPAAPVPPAPASLERGAQRPAPQP